MQCVDGRIHLREPFVGVIEYSVNVRLLLIQFRYEILELLRNCSISGDHAISACVAEQPFWAICSDCIG